MGCCASRTAVKAAAEVVSAFDTDGDGELDKEEQAELVNRAVANGADREALEQTLRDADTDGDGLLSLEELAVIAPTLMALLESKTNIAFKEIAALDAQKVALYAKLPGDMKKEKRRHPEEVFARQAKMVQRHAEEAKAMHALLPDRQPTAFVRNDHKAKIQQVADAPLHTVGFNDMLPSEQTRCMQFSLVFDTMMQLVKRSQNRPAIDDEPMDSAEQVCQQVLNNLHTIIPAASTAGHKRDGFRLALISLLARAVPTSQRILLCAVAGVEGFWVEKHGIGPAESWDESWGEIDMVCEVLAQIGGVADKVKDEADPNCYTFTWSVNRGVRPFTRKFHPRTNMYDPCPATGAFDMQVQLQVFHEPKNAASILVDCMPDQHFARSPNQTTVACVSSPQHLAVGLTSEVTAALQKATASAADNW